MPPFGSNIPPVPVKFPAIRRFPLVELNVPPLISMLPASKFVVPPLKDPADIEILPVIMPLPRLKTPPPSERFPVIVPLFKVRVPVPDLLTFPRITPPDPTLILAVPETFRPAFDVRLELIVSVPAETTTSPTDIEFDSTG